MRKTINTVEMVGNTYGRLTVVSACDKTKRGKMVTCYCSCGRGYKNMVASDLLRGKIDNCGCRKFPPIGALFKNKQGLDFTVLDYCQDEKGYTILIIEFTLSGFITHSALKEVNNGSVKDKLNPSVAVVGYLGDGKYTASGDDKVCYQTWNDMMKRCYAPKTKEVAKRYGDVDVCKEWHNYQNYAFWFKENHVCGYSVDKDLRVFGSKLYSPETCTFVPEALNSFLTGGLKRGIHFNNCKGVWIAQCQDAEVTSKGNKKQTYLGSYKDEFEALAVYKHFKLNKLKLLKVTYSDIPDVVYTNIEKFIMDLK